MRIAFYLLAAVAIALFLISLSVPTVDVPGLGPVATEYVGWAALIASWACFFVARSRTRAAAPRP